MREKFNAWEFVQWDGVKYASGWRRWWAWRPVTTIGGHRIWFDWCYMRYRLEIGPSDLGVYHRRYEYATVFDLIKD